MRPNLERSVLAAATAAAVASVVLVVSAWRAVDMPAAQPEPFALAPAAEAVAELSFRALPAEAVTLIAENEPFRENRSPAPEAYRMPGDRPPERTERALPPPPEPPAFTVLGTVLVNQGGMAVIQTGDGQPPLFVNVNESVEGYRLTAVDVDGATLARGDASFQLAVAEPALLRDQSAQARNRNTTNNNSNARRAQQQREEQAREALEQQTQRLRELMEQTRQGGGAGTVFFGQGGQQGTINFTLPGGGQAGGQVIIEEQTVDPRTGDVRQRVIAVPRQRQGQ